VVHVEVGVAVWIASTKTGEPPGTAQGITESPLVAGGTPTSAAVIVPVTVPEPTGLRTAKHHHAAICSARTKVNVRLQLPYVRRYCLTVQTARIRSENPTNNLEERRSKPYSLCHSSIRTSKGHSASA